MNVSKARTISNRVRAKYPNALSPVKWTDVYSSEGELVEDLRNIHVPEDIEKDWFWMGCEPFYKGYVYIHSFAKQVQSGRELSKKQLTQCKRLAVEIKCAAAIRDCY